MRILGIDPGYAIVGFGVTDFDGYKFKTISFGAITTDAGTPFNLRLKAIFDDMNRIIKLYEPDSIAVEKLFFNTNQKTGIDVAEARGVIILSAVNLGVPVYEYTPLQVKQSVVGYGRAEKNQVMQMTKSILGLREVPKPDDAADALAIAICHGHSAPRTEARGQNTELG
ncbi:MAG: crossover junction endodeoxyribonuclease RuvC [Ruminococcus sp.]|jgi:crossover junction endodeoxyribonuclease RuvC|nr:crossover junction endodeoxyribonuclease RuvC [Ruminococcus sp.]